MLNHRGVYIHLASKYFALNVHIRMIQMDEMNSQYEWTDLHSLISLNITVHLKIITTT